MRSSTACGAVIAGTAFVLSLIALSTVAGVTEAAHSTKHVQELTPDNFDSVVMDPAHNVLVKFYAPWCGHCQAFAPQWERLGKEMAEKGVDAKLVALDASRYSTKAREQGVRGFPWIKLYPKHDKGHALTYIGARDVGSMLVYLSKNVGSPPSP
jgi:protein disulfide-isomerase-like protein